MLSRYTSVYQQIWYSNSFRSLGKIPPSPHTLFIFILTGPHTTSLPGLYRIGPGYISDVLKWNLTEVHKAIKQLSSRHMIRYNSKNCLIYLPKWSKFNSPSNPNVLTSWVKDLKNIPNCQLKELFLNDLKALLKALPKAFGNTFEKYYTKPMVIHEHEHEQEKEQESERIPARADLPSLDFPKFESEFPEVDHQKEFDRCYSYYKAHGRQILDWDECYKIWLSKPYDKAQKKKESQVQAYIIPLRDDLKEIKTDNVHHICSHCGQKSVSVSDNGKDEITGFYCQHCGTFDFVEVENIKEINDV